MHFSVCFTCIRKSSLYDDQSRKAFDFLLNFSKENSRILFVQYRIAGSYPILANRNQTAKISSLIIEKLFLKRNLKLGWKSLHDLLVCINKITCVTSIKIRIRAIYIKITKIWSVSFTPFNTRLSCCAAPDSRIIFDVILFHVIVNRLKIRNKTVCFII